MDGTTLFLLSVGTYSVLPLLYALVPKPTRYLFFFVHLAAVLTLGGILGAFYVLPVAEDVTLLAGQVAYGAFMFATLVLIVSGRDIRLLRGVVLLVIGVNVLVYALFSISHEALLGGAVPNPLDASPAVFDQSLRVVLVGGSLIVAELLLMLAILELAKRRLPSMAMAPVYVLTYVGVLLLDGVLFPTLAFGPFDDPGQVIAGAVTAKAYLAGAFAIPLTVFVLAYRPALTRFETSPMRLGTIFGLRRDELLERIDQQQEELEQERARLTQTTALSGRATATTTGLLRSAVNSVLLVTDESLRITRASTGALKLLGYSEGELIGRRLDSLHTPAEWQRITRTAGVPHDRAGDPIEVARALALTDGHRDCEYLTSDGGVRTISSSLSTILDDDTVVGYLCAGEDVTDRVRAERAVTAALQRENQALVRLQEVDQIKADLISNVSHELRTPLSSVSGYLELVAEGDFGEITDQQRHAFDRIFVNTGRLERLVDDLLTVGASEAGTLALDPIDVDLRDVVESVRDLFEELGRGREVSLGLDLGPDPVRVRADPAALERVLINLVSNAFKFTDGPGRIVVEVRPESASNGHRPGGRLTVRDTGIGIAPEEQRQLFTRFYRSRDAAARAIPGSGLGLSIVHSIVRAHGGTVSVDSTVGVGTTVTVHLSSDPLLPLTTGSADSEAGSALGG